MGGARVPSSLLWVISLFEGVLGCQKPHTRGLP